MPISFHRSLRPFPAVDSARPVEDSLRHPYVATVVAGGNPLPTIQRGLEEAPISLPTPRGVKAVLVRITQRLRRVFSRPTKNDCGRPQIHRPCHLAPFPDYSRVCNPDTPVHRPQRPRIGTGGTHLPRPFSILRRRMWVVRSGRRTRTQVLVYHS